MITRSRRRLLPLRGAGPGGAGTVTAGPVTTGPVTTGPVTTDAWIRLGAAAGVAGPAAFTAAWIAASLLQTGHSAAEVQISGLAAPDARDPWIMIAGFAALGGCSAGLGSALHRALGGAGQAGPGPRLIQAAGVLTVAAGLLRRDQVLLTAPASESWHNLAASSLVAAAILAVFFSQALAPWNGVLQRIGVTVPLAGLCAVAVRLLVAGRAGSGPVPSRRLS